MSQLARATEFPVGAVFDILFPQFTPRLTILSSTELEFEIIAGAYFGMKERVLYQAVMLRPGLFMVTWQEKSNTTVVHLEDFARRKAHTNVTFSDSRFVRMTGDIRMYSSSNSTESS